MISPSLNHNLVRATVFFSTEDPVNVKMGRFLLLTDDVNRGGSRRVASDSRSDLGHQPDICFSQGRPGFESSNPEDQSSWLIAFGDPCTVERSTFELYLRRPWEVLVFTITTSLQARPPYSQVIPEILTFYC
jgi:hypothetical protein